MKKRNLSTVISLCFIIGLTGCFDNDNPSNGTAVLEANQSPWSPGVLQMTGTKSSPGDGNSFVSHTFTVEAISDSDENERKSTLFTKTIVDDFHDYYISEVPVDDKIGTIELQGLHRVTLTTVNNRGDIKVATKIIEFNTRVTFVSFPNTDSNNESDDSCIHSLSSKTYDDVEAAVVTLASDDGCYSFNVHYLYNAAVNLNYALSDDSIVAFLGIGGAGADGQDSFACIGGSGGDAGGAMMTTTYSQWDDDYGNNQNLYYLIGDTGDEDSFLGGLGGASTILTADMDHLTSETSRILVAGGGGGAASCPTVFSDSELSNGGDGGVAIPNTSGEFTWKAGGDGESPKSEYVGKGGSDGSGGSGATYSGNNDGGDGIGGFGGGRPDYTDYYITCTQKQGAMFVNNINLKLDPDTSGIGGDIGQSDPSNTNDSQWCMGGSGGGGWGGGGGSYTLNDSNDSGGAGGGGSFTISSTIIDSDLDTSDNFKDLRSSAISSHGEMIVILKPQT